MKFSIACRLFVIVPGEVLFVDSVDLDLLAHRLGEQKEERSQSIYVNIGMFVPEFLDRDLLPVLP